MKTDARKMIPCKWCGKPTPMLGTEMCDRCWELEGRIKQDPELAKRMLAVHTIMEHSKATP